MESLGADDTDGKAEWSRERERASQSVDDSSSLSDLCVETRSFPKLARCYPCSFAFYVALPGRSVLSGEKQTPKKS
jgi:hypothetical protein